MTTLTAATARETIYAEIRRTDRGPAQIGDMLHYISTLTPQNGQTMPADYRLAGFSLRDREILQSFTQQYLQTGNLSFKQLGVAGSRLPKYWRQLAHWYGFEVDYQYEPDKDPATFKISKPTTVTKAVQTTAPAVTQAKTQVTGTSKFDPRNTNGKYPRYNDNVTDGRQTMTVKEFVKTYASAAQRTTSLFAQKGAWGRLFGSVNNAVGGHWYLTTETQPYVINTPAHIMNDSPAQMPAAAYVESALSQYVSVPVGTVVNFY